jgi:hypothetical protein
VDLDATAVDEQSVRGVSCSRQSAEDALPNAALGPSHEPVIKRLLGSIDVSTVNPTTAATKGMDDPTQHTTIIHPCFAAHIGRKQRLDPSPLRIGKPKEISHLTASLMRQ